MMSVHMKHVSNCAIVDIMTVSSANLYAVLARSSGYSGTLVCEHNSFRKLARNPKHSYIKVNFLIRCNGNSDDSFQNSKILI
jgi:hypothetical protein